MKTANFTKAVLLSTIVGAVAAVAGLAGSAPVNALVDTPWGPDRETFTWADPAPYATFNSITDNPQLGDERNFVRIREVADGNKFGDEVNLEMGKTYEVYIYYHNNADAHEVGKTAIGIADGAAVKSSFPATVKKGERATVTGTIFASDTNPLSVWDGAYMMPTQDLYLRYVPGTATIHNGGELNGQNIGPDYLFGDGALLGYNTFSGILPGCNEYAGYITYQIFADAPDFEVTKTVVDGSTTVKPGDEVTFKIRYENTGTMDQKNVVVRDTLPEGLVYVPGSAMLYNNNFPKGKAVNDDLVTEHGMSIGDYAGGDGWAELTYKVKVADDVTCDEELTNSALVSTTDGNKSAEMTLTLPECEPEEPEENCDTNPELPECQTPEELPDTGPVEAAVAAVIVMGIGGGGYYFYRTKRALRLAQQGIVGGTGSDALNAKLVDGPQDETIVTPQEPIIPAADAASTATDAESAHSMAHEAHNAREMHGHRDAYGAHEDHNSEQN